MALQPSFAHAKAASAGARAYPRRRPARRPVVAALRLASRLVLGIPAAFGVFVLGVGLFGLGVGLGGIVGFMVFARAWPLP